jgi:putative flippase GtrA
MFCNHITDDVSRAAGKRPAKRTTHDLTPRRFETWLRFNLVGLGGFAVQILALAALEQWRPIPVPVAIAISVLAAVSHNFVWHERVTWPGQPPSGRLRRWLSFNISTGLSSVLVNLAATTIVNTLTGAPLLLSNAIAVASASLWNFWISDRFVFGSQQRLVSSPLLRTPLNGDVPGRPLPLRGASADSRC